METKTYRPYTTTGAYPEQFASPAPAGTIVTVRFPGRAPTRYRLTETRLHDGTFAAESVDYL